LYQFAIIISKDLISTKKETKRRYKKKNPGQTSRRHNYPAGYSDDDDSTDHSVRSDRKRKANTLPNKNQKKLKKDEQKMGSKSKTAEQNHNVNVRDDDSFLEGLSQESIQTLGMLYYVFYCNT
jgi:hypothetical protein